MRLNRLYGLSLCLLVFGCASVAEMPLQNAPAASLTFLHLNDTYRIDAVEEGRRGGFGRVATIIRQLKAEGRDVRVLHGGDFLYPSLESQLWEGEQMVEALNFLDALAPLYVVPGNHEFDPRGPEPLVRRVRESGFDWLGENFRFATGEADVDASLQTAFTFRTGTRKVGIFALGLHPDDGGNLRDYTPFESGYVAQAENAIERLEAENVDLIIGLTHLHLADDIEVAALKARHPKFMFVVGGHEHEPEYAAGTASSAAVMKGASNARTIWRVDVRFEESGPRIEESGPRIEETKVAIDTSIEIDAEYQLIADKWRARLLELVPFLESRVGQATMPLDGREVTVRNRESSWGNYIADQMRTAFRNPPSELAFVNSGTLRIDDFIAEDITFEDIGRTFGYATFLRYMTINGADFRQLLEAGYRGVGPSKGYFPQVSGFRVCIDRGKPEGERIVQMQVPTDGDEWREMDSQRDYSLVAPDYVYRGGDGYDFSKARDVSRPGSELKYLVLDGVIRAQAEGRAVGVPVDPDQPRIAFLADESLNCFKSALE